MINFVTNETTIMDELSDAYAGGVGGAATPLPPSMGTGETIAVHAGLFPSLLSFEWAFSGILDSLVQEKY